MTIVLTLWLSNPQDITIADYFARLGGLYARLNNLTKPMQVYNADESYVNIITKPEKVFAEVERRAIHTVTAAKKGKTHTIYGMLFCIWSCPTTKYDFSQRKAHSKANERW